MSPHRFTTAIFLAGGSSSRMRNAVVDKVLHKIQDKPVWKYSFEAFAESGCIDHIVFVCRDAAQQAAIEREDRSASLNITFTKGGKERQDSVWAGLQAAPSGTEVVLIHDLARPLITPQAIRESAKAAAKHGAACVARKTTDTIKRCEEKGDGYVLETVDRSNLWSMETPQSFQYSLINDAYKTVIQTGQRITDDLSAIEGNGHPVVFIDNRRPNPKLTTEQDLSYIEFLLLDSPH